MFEKNSEGTRQRANETLNLTPVRKWGEEQSHVVTKNVNSLTNNRTFLRSHSANGPPLLIKGEKASSITAKACIVLLPHIL